MQPEELEERLKRIEEAIEQLLKTPRQYNINIEKVDVHDPVLENLTFRLDELDIQELSGALNLGNNFGVKVKDGKSEKKKMHRMEKEIKKKLQEQNLEYDLNDRSESKKHKKRKKSKKNKKSSGEETSNQTVINSEEGTSNAEERWITIENDE